MGGNAWILDPQDKAPGDDMWDKKGRSEFRIHLWLEDAHNKGSNGCIVLSKDCHAAFEKLVNSTTPGPKTRIRTPKTRNRFGKVTEWEEFDEVELLGAIVVK